MRLLSIIIFLTIQTTVQGQIFINLDGKKINCDSAYTNLEMGLCSRQMLENSIEEYKGILNTLYTCLDKLIAEDKKERAEMLKEDQNQKFDFWTDYEKIKEMYIESSKLFEKHADLEMEIEGEFYGPGRERVVGENMRLKQLYDSRIQEIRQIIKLHCG